MEFNKRVEISSSVERMILHGGSKLEEADTFIACDRVWSWILKCELCMYHEICLHHRFYLFRGLVPMLKPFQLLRREFPLQALLVPTVTSAMSLALKSLLFFCSDIFEP